MSTSQGTLKNTPIAMNIIDFILNLYHDPLTIRFLQNVGGMCLCKLLFFLERDEKSKPVHSKPMRVWRGLRSQYPLLIAMVKLLSKTDMRRLN